ncbi:TOMM precursor leader peptide-binding protein [Streptomyces jumonjinensis]|uniref:TOMM leader peptide-binding protein n=1 Tax=Streptomyces jumonjinensis TaxID=1945 RepID=A0A646KMR0_STRJU|nr:TOMM precursor leader peptide-binding protein [Streptomyces jumonjinensis]MQT03592.1 TOMM precursor leader peptide-binding protein [Streptomyces jumonjinensis]
MTAVHGERPVDAPETTRGRRVGFRSHLRAEVVAGDAAYLLSDGGVTALQGEQIEALVPLLDGTRDLPSVLREASRTIPAEQAGRLIGRLAQAGLVGYSAPAPETPADGVRGPALAYWELAGLDGAESLQRLTAARVQVLTVGGVTADRVLEASAAAGLSAVCGDARESVGAGSAAQLSVVVCDDYLNPQLREIDALHQVTGRPWLLARPGGPTAWLGPVFVPGAGACWSCLAHRLRGHRMSEAPVRRALGLAGPVPRPAARVPASSSAAAQLTVLEAAKWLAGYRYPSQSSVATLDTLSLTTRHHELRRRPQCPDCGDPGLVSAWVKRPVTLVSRPKTPYGGGGHRARSVQEVQDRYAYLVSPVTGVVDTIRRDPRAPQGLHCYLAGRNPAVGGNDLAQLRAGLRQVSGGKGATALEAEVSALCESLERYSGTLQGDEPRVRDSLRALGEAAVSPDSCQLFAPRQFRDRDRWNALNSSYHWVPEPFDDRAPVDWTPVWSLTERRQRLLPTGMLYYGGPQEGPASMPAGRRSLRADSNGNAAGSSLEDAILHGFLELVERDAVALWWYNRTRQPAAELTGPGGFGDPWTEELIGVYRELNREVWALDLTSDLGVPVFAALSRRTDKPAEDIMFGFGAHFDPVVAMRRALTEMNQLLPAVVDARADGGGYGSTAPEPIGWWWGATVGNQPYLLPDPGAPARGPADFPARCRPDLRDDVDTAVALLKNHGMDMLVLDQTRPDIGIPVVKVVVPGLRHFWARYAPGRLFDVPVRMGLLSSPTPYDDLNPVPLFV